MHCDVLELIIHGISTIKKRYGGVKRLRIGENLFVGIKISKQREDKNKELLAKLSSGKSINNAADNAAGLTISESMRAQIRGLNQASRNVQDTKSMLQTSDGGLETATNVLQRLRDLSVMTINDTLTDQDRAYADLELQEAKAELNRICKNTEFNTQKTYEEHFPVYETIEGNAVIKPPVVVEAGYNDLLKLWVDGKEEEIYLDEGEYEVDDFLYMMDEKLLDADENIILSLTKDNTLNLSAEGYHEMRISGGAGSFIYEYHLGRGPGTVYGSSDLSGELHIIAGSNDVFKFNVGNNPYSVNFPPTPGGWSGTGYTSDQIVEMMNTQLKAQGANVKVYMHGNNIALDPGYQTIDGFSGNMIKIDGITSILYDNAKYGMVSKSQGFTLGRVNLFSGTTITAGVNDTIEFKLDGVNDCVITLAAKTYNNIGEIIDEINARLTDPPSINAYANFTSYGVGNEMLRLNSNAFGTGSQVSIDTNSSAYNTLFRLVNTTDNPPSIITGQITIPEVDGVINGLAASTTITDGENDQLEITADGITKVIDLTAGSYTQTQLKDAINLQLIGLNATASIQDNRIRLIHTQSGNGTSLSVNKNSSAYEELFCKNYPIAPTLVGGKTITILPPEGSTLPVTFQYTKASAAGSRDISGGLEIMAANDSLNFVVNGTPQTVKFDPGSYSAAQLVTRLNTVLSGKGVTARLEDSKYLILETDNGGADQTITTLSGTAYEDLFVGTQLAEPNPLSSVGQNLPSYLSGKINIGADSVTINNSNNKLKFTYVANGVNTMVDLALTEKTYIGGIDDVNDELLVELNTKLPAGITAVSNGGYLRLQCDNPGPNYSIKDLQTGGVYQGFYDSCLNGTTATFTDPIKSDGFTSTVPAYIVGRKDLPVTEDIVINPKINDTLTFDYYYNGSKSTISVKLTAGSYRPSEMATEINSQLVAQGIDDVKAEYGTIISGTTEDDSNKLALRNYKTDNGSCVIDGIRGTAAYSMFYDASSEPVPTYTVGVRDLSSGIEIVAGQNEKFIFDENGVPRELTFPAKTYDKDEFLAEVNLQLTALGSEVIASYSEGKLKLSFDTVGYNTIDNIRGNGRELFFNIEERDGLDGPYYQVGANTGETLKIDKPPVSVGLLHMNMARIDDSKAAEKTLRRVDKAIGILSQKRGYIGAIDNRLEHIINNNENYAVQLQDAESRISDLDMAKAMAEMIKEKLLGDVSLNIQAQSKVNAAKVLEFLK